jgi:hypothetical protein
MTGGTLLIVVIAGILAVLSGWLLPLVFKSRRPFGVWADIAVCVVFTVVLAYVEWFWDGVDLCGGSDWRSLDLGLDLPLADEEDQTVGRSETDRMP